MTYTALEYLQTWASGKHYWLSREHAGLGKASNSELRRWCNTALLINTEHVTWDELLDFPIFSATLFSGKNKITLF